MEKYGLIGHPIADSGSPALFKAAYGGRYRYDLIEGDDFETSWAKFLAGYKAINITAPFKENAYRKVLEAAISGKGDMDGSVFRTGATNLVMKAADGSLHAYNSDFTGIVYCISEALFPGIVDRFTVDFGDRAPVKLLQFAKQGIAGLYNRKPQALIVGCGGAGRAAAVASAELGFSTALMNRTPQKAQAIVDKLPQYNFISVPIVDFKHAFRECELVIYTLPLSLPALGELDIADFEGEDRYGGMTPGKIILEANYKTPSFTPELLTLSSSAGAQYIPGRRWLLYQAISGYSLMTGEIPDAEAMIAGVK